MPTSAQPHITLNDGHMMPQFGLGVWQTRPDVTASVVRDALAAGYLAVDTAAIYDNEEGVGEALEGRDDIYLTTKVWNSDHGHDKTLRAFDASTKRLRRETIDLYLIHWPAAHQDRYVETWKALAQLKASGRVKSIGVSNFTLDHLRRIVDETGIVPALNQVELHPRFQQTKLRAFHVANGIHTESWSPLGRGKLLDDPILAEIAAKHGRTPAQIIIRWHLDNGLVVIPKTVNPTRLRENIAALDLKLDADDLARIAALDAPSGRIGPDPATAAF